MDKLKVTTEESNGVTIVRVSGEADMLSTEILERALDRITVQRPPVVLLDLTGLTFLTSLGMGALARFSHSVKRNGQVRLHVPPGHVRDVLQRSRVIELFEQVDAV